MRATFLGPLTRATPLRIAKGKILTQVDKLKVFPCQAETSYFVGLASCISQAQENEKLRVKDVSGRLSAAVRTIVHTHTHEACVQVLGNHPRRWAWRRLGFLVHLLTP